MKAATLLLALLPLYAATDFHPRTKPSAVQSAIEVLVRTDSGVGRGAPVSHLRYPHQAPWREEFWIRIRPSPVEQGGQLGLLVSFDVWLGREIAIRGETDALNRREIDRRGAWFRGRVTADTVIDCADGCPEGIVLGPFTVDEVMPNGSIPSSRLFPTRLRVSAQLMPSGAFRGKLASLSAERVLPIR